MSKPQGCGMEGYKERVGLDHRSIGEPGSVVDTCCPNQADLCSCSFTRDHKVEFNGNICRFSDDKAHPGL